MNKTGIPALVVNLTNIHSSLSFSFIFKSESFQFIESSQQQKQISLETFQFIFGKEKLQKLNIQAYLVLLRFALLCFLHNKSVIKFRFFSEVFFLGLHVAAFALQPHFFPLFLHLSFVFKFSLLPRAPVRLNQGPPSLCPNSVAFQGTRSEAFNT